MADYKPVIISNGEFRQLQAADNLIINGLKVFSSGGVAIGNGADPGTNALSIDVGSAGARTIGLYLGGSYGAVTNTALISVGDSIGGTVNYVQFGGYVDAGASMGFIVYTKNVSGASNPSARLLVGGDGISRVIGPSGDTFRFYNSFGANEWFQVGRNSGTGYLDFDGTQGGAIGFNFKKRIITPRVVVTYSASITIDASLGNLFIVTVTNGTAFTMNAPTNPTDGQHIIVTFRNASGGSAGAITWNAVWKIITPFPNLTNATSNSLFFYYDGTNWIMSNYMTGVPN